MTDSYLAIDAIANDSYMQARLNACATQQWELGAIDIGDTWGDGVTAPLSWVANSRYVWASAPGWGEAWESALASHPDDDTYSPGKDEAVITDDMILSTVQAIAPKAEAPPEPEPEPEPEP
jgi:hypothetical protein